MSNRKLRLLQPHEVEAMFNVRAIQIRSAQAAQAELDERKAFAEQAEQQLGYERLQSVLKRETLNTPCDLVLLRTLTDMDIRPLDSVSVVAYMQRMANNKLNVLMKAIGIPALIAGGLGLIGTAIIAMFQAPQSAVPFVGSFWVWGLIFGIGFFLTWAEHTFVPRYEWSKTSLKDFGRWGDKKSLLPRAVLELAMRVKQENPDIVLQVRELRKDYGPPAKLFDWANAVGSAIMDPDPFLEVEFGGESYFIAVWNEPGFDGKLMRVE
jgi:hypothetical protein